MIKPVSKLARNDLHGKKILLRVDFNVPVENGKVSEIYRLETNKKAIDFFHSSGAITVLVSHITAIKSFKNIIGDIENAIGRKFVFLNDLRNLGKKLADAEPDDLFLLDNIRQYEGEEKNDAAFARRLAKPFDIYVNNAFSVSHRDHASMVAVAGLLPAYGGPLLMDELENFEKAVKLPLENKTLIIGGAKVSTKLPVIENFLDKAEHILIGGVIANVFLKAGGMDIGKSEVDDDYLPRAKKYLGIHKELAIPKDFVIKNKMILDIGPKTVAEFEKIIGGSTTVIWDGPLGKLEIPEFAAGTEKIASAVADSAAFSIVGGGDTIAVLESLKIMKKINYVSPSGGAMLEFLAGGHLPGLAALGYYD